MQYVISSRWSFVQSFTITDPAGTPQFEVRGNLGFTKNLSFLDESGREIAEIAGHMFSGRFDIVTGGQVAATIAHSGFFGDRYEVDSASGPIMARGNLAGWNYVLSRGGGTIATVSRQLALRERFEVDIAPGENDAFLLAVVLAIEACHHQREEREHHGGGLGLGGIAGMGGGGIGGLPGLPRAGGGIGGGMFGNR